MLVFCFLFIFIIIYKYLIMDPKDGALVDQTFLRDLEVV